MGIFDSSSSSSTQNFSEETTTDIDKDIGFQDAGGVLALGEQSGFGNRVNVEILDNGAINSAFEFAEESQAFWGENFDSVLGTVEQTNNRAFDFAEDSLGKANDQTSEALVKVGEANENSVVAQRNLITAFSDKANSEATLGLSSLLKPALFIGGGFLLLKTLKG